MNKNSDWDELSVWILNIFQIKGHFLCEYYRQGSGSHDITYILLEIVLHLYTEKGQESRWVKRKRLNGSRMFIFYTSVTVYSWFLSIRS